MNGGLVLRAGVRAGRTVLLESRGTYPLQVVRPCVAASEAGLSLVMLLLSGGLLDGDSASIDVVVEPGARLALRTQAATQVHAGRSCQTLRATVGKGGWFSYVPHAIVPHAGADYHQQADVSLEPEARVLVADALSPGRVWFGEECAYRQVQLDLDVWCAGELVARERALLRPDASTRRAQYGAFSHVGGAYLIGRGAPPFLEACDGMLVGTSALARGGWLVRVLADRASELDTLLNRLQLHWWTESLASPIGDSAVCR